MNNNRVSMTLGKLFVDQTLDSSLRRLRVRGIADDSRLLKRGEIFFIRERLSFDVFSVLASLEKNAVAIVAAKKNQKKIKHLIMRVPIILVDDIEKEFRRAVDRFYGFSADDFVFIGVTGTNGKTTVATLIHYLLKKQKCRAALFGTVQYEITGTKIPATHTTPDYLALRKLCAIAKAKRVRYVVMEVSSHALTQGRITGIPFAVSIFTNLTRDHLDYHKTMSAYFNAKRLLFRQNEKAAMVINADDAYGKKLLRFYVRAVSYGIAPSALVRARAVVLGTAVTEFDIVYRGKTHHIVTPLLGQHNISNILAAFAVLSILRLHPDVLVRHIRTFKGAVGRLQRVSAHIFVDYAHTPDALEKTLRALLDVGYEKIICVFGCGGNRDTGKRRQMGAIAARYARWTFITADNPRLEDPRDICRQIQEGFHSGGYRVIIDRRRAIRKALELYSQTREKGYNKCCVLIAGKGHEDYQVIGTKKIPFSDAGVVQNIFAHEHN